MEIEEILQIIEDESTIDVDKSFLLAKQVSILQRSNSNESRKILIYILDNWKKIPEETHLVWTNLIETEGFYPYLEKEKLKLNSLVSNVRKQYHYSINLNKLNGSGEKKYFHEEQKYLKSIIDAGKNLIVSAPTSFGKSVLIEDVVASRKFKNLVVIQPTIALLDETRKKLQKYNQFYKIIVRTSQVPSQEKGNIFLLTAERVVEYKELPLVDFFVIDEFYKLSALRDDERSDILNNAFYKLLNIYPRPQFYLLGPNIDGISEGFAEKYKAIFYKTDYSLVENKVIDLYSENKEVFDKTSHPRKTGYQDATKYKEEILFKLLDSNNNEQTIIYCSSPKRVRELAYKFTKYLIARNTKKTEAVSLVEWVNENIHPGWNLIDFLTYCIGINDGALQKHINSSIIDYFNEGKLKYLFCTTTIIEGVNTSAKNVIFFDRTKGSKTLIDYFDYSNIKGRSGRMMIHYIGKIFNFNPPPKKLKMMIVDIPFYQQNPIKDEVLNGLSTQDIRPEVKITDQYKQLVSIPIEERQLFQKNGVTIKGQKQILDIFSNLDQVYTIDKNIKPQRFRVYDLLFWNRTPKYEQLQFLLELGWEHLLKPKESRKVKSLRQLTYLTFNYGLEQNIMSLVAGNLDYAKKQNTKSDSADTELLNQSIEEIFNVMRHWFQYKIPKWLSVMNELQKYACEKNRRVPGNYTYYASQIENDFVRDNLTILAEYGIPTSAINKLKPEISTTLSEDDVIVKVRELTSQKIGLIEYELEMIRKSLN